ncbi:unnamed protein product [Orchesella dallaii]|uniref:Uncharacterized protein n=1 Tax=Orchesella dallaii TaxID=48710 RepID=A0ABP1RR84_9HEXA
MNQDVMKPMVIGMWALCGVALLIVCGVLLFVIWEGKRSNKEEEEEGDKMESGSDTPSVYVVPVPDSDMDDEVFEGAPHLNIAPQLKSRSSLTEIYMRTKTKSYSEGTATGSLSVTFNLDANSNLRC